MDRMRQVHSFMTASTRQSPITQSLWPVVGMAILVAQDLLSCSPSGSSYPPALERAHAHNDYLHPRPLFDALAHGFASVEVDVFNLQGSLLVGHSLESLDAQQTLQSLYLAPLLELVAEHGQVYPGWPQFTLVIDIKSDAQETHPVLCQTLENYSQMLTTADSSKTTPGPIVAILSGNRSLDQMQKEPLRYAGVDGRLSDLNPGLPVSLIPLISENWIEHFTWNGSGPMPEDQHEKLLGVVESVHAQGRRIRFWGTLDLPSPARTRVWRELVSAGVDLINTDDLDGLQEFLTSPDLDRLNQ